MRILLATRNNDKFDIVRRLMEAAAPDAQIISLSDAAVKGEVVEVGSIRERALQKAEFFLAVLERLDRVDDFDAVLAVDDGLSIDGAEPDPNSKVLADKLLAGAWKPGVSVDVVRAFALVRVDEKPRIETTRVPFTFLGNGLGVKREPGRYPLSAVLAPIGSTKPIGQWGTAEEDEFNSRHSREALLRLLH